MVAPVNKGVISVLAGTMAFLVDPGIHGEEIPGWALVCRKDGHTYAVRMPEVTALPPSLKESRTPNLSQLTCLWARNLPWEPLASETMTNAAYQVRGDEETSWVVAQTFAEPMPAWQTWNRIREQHQELFDRSVPALTSQTTANGQTIYTLRIGPYTEETARKINAKLQNQGLYTHYVTWTTPADRADTRIETGHEIDNTSAKRRNLDQNQRSEKKAVKPGHDKNATATEEKIAGNGKPTEVRSTTVPIKVVEASAQHTWRVETGQGDGVVIDNPAGVRIETKENDLFFKRGASGKVSGDDKVVVDLSAGRAEIKAGPSIVAETADRLDLKIRDIRLHVDKHFEIKKNGRTLTKLDRAPQGRRVEFSTDGAVEITTEMNVQAAGS